jgi:hypothetical protein
MRRFVNARILAVVACALGLWAWGTGEARAIQPILVEIKKESDSSFTYIFKIKIDDGVQVEGGKDAADFFTIYNFAGLVPDSAKSPEGWKFSTADEGPTPMRGSKALINPTDIKDLPNITWTYTGTKPLKGSAEITGFSVRTKVAGTMTGEYGVQVTRLTPGTLGGKDAKDSKDSKEARIGSITTPEVKEKK